MYFFSSRLYSLPLAVKRGLPARRRGAACRAPPAPPAPTRRPGRSAQPPARLRQIPAQ